MYRRVAVGVILLIAILGVIALTACGGKTEERIRASWIKPQVTGSTAAVSVSEVKNNRISHFKVGTAVGEISFMAYELEGKLYTRADICPPCRSERFSLKGSTLVCDSCNTVFDARTGNGVEGACVNYPKASVAYTIAGDRMTLKTEDLISTYRETLKPGP